MNDIELGASNVHELTLELAYDLVSGEFDRAFYLRRNPDVARAGVDPLQHYLTHGWREGRRPVVWFEPDKYTPQNIGDLDPEIPSFAHFLYRKGRNPSDGAPSSNVAAEFGWPDYDLLEPYFDPEFYLKSYPAVAKHGMDPISHYLQLGWKLGYDPSYAFNTNFYLANYQDVLESGMCPFVHYLRHGRLEGRFATARHESAAADTTADATIFGKFSGLIQLMYPAIKNIDLVVANRFILLLFAPEDYRKLKSLDISLSRTELLAHYIAFGLPEGVPPGPLFDKAFYQKAIDDGKIGRLGTGPLFHEWLIRGIYKRITPTPLFREEDYIALNPDLLDYNGWLFEHFLLAGRSEGRQFIKRFQISRNAFSDGADGTALADTTASTFISWASNQSRSKKLNNAQDHWRMSEFWDSAIATEIFAKANTLEPDIGSMKRYEHFLAPPWHDSDYHEFATVKAAITDLPVDDIIFMPFCKLGGADFVAGVLAHSLVAENRKVIVIRTEQSDWARPDWFPDHVKSIDLSIYLNRISPANVSRVLYEIVRLSGAKNVFNVNSYRAFSLFERFGKQLSTITKTHAYYFCADRDADGFEAGYPIWFFANLIEHLTTAIFDTADLRARLAKRYNLTDALKSKMRTIYTPAMTEPRIIPAVENQNKTRSTRSKPTILWAGRLDKQKRFDIVIEIANQMPNVQFLCWGKAVLDKPPSLEVLPTNMVMKGSFKSFEELPLDDCDGWLYTSEWDGLPTILIECAALGLPVVASAVGGVPELITAETGWPVENSEDVSAYVSAIVEMLSDDEERLSRVQRLQQLIRARHRMTYYQDNISEISTEKYDG